MSYTYAEAKREKMTGEESYILWWNRIAACQRWRRNYWNGDRAWDRYYRAYKGFQWEDDESLWDDLSSDNLPDRTTVNITASNIQAMVPFLVSEGAEYKGKPRKPSSVVSAMLQTSTLNYEFKHRNCQEELKKVVYDGAILGSGIVKSGFTRKIDEARLKSQGDIVYDDMIEDETAYLKRVEMKNFWFDYCASERNLQTARYTIERYFKYVPDIMANKSYDQNVLDKIDDNEYKIETTDATGIIRTSGLDYDFLIDNVYDDPEANVGVLYEIWDKKFNKVYVFLAGCVEPLIEKSNPYPYLKGELPYIKYDFIYQPDEWYGAGMVRLMETLQYELNRHRTFAFNHRRKCSNTIFEVAEDVNPDELEKLPDAEDGTYIITPNANSIRVVDQGLLNRDYAIYESLIKGDIQELLGLDALAKGQNLQSRATLGEVSQRTNILSLKLNERSAYVDRLFLKSGIHMNAHISANYYKERIIQLFGAQGEYWVRYNNEDLKDEIDLEMETVAAQKTSPDVDRQQRIQLFGMIMQMLPLIQAGAIPPDQINFVEILKWTIEGFGRQDTGRFFKAALSPTVPLSEMQVISPEEFGEQAFQPQQPGQGLNSSQDILRSMASGNGNAAQIAGIG